MYVSIRSTSNVDIMWPRLELLAALRKQHGAKHVMLLQRSLQLFSNLTLMLLVKRWKVFTLFSPYIIWLNDFNYEWDARVNLFWVLQATVIVKLLSGLITACPFEFHFPVFSFSLVLRNLPVCSCMLYLFESVHVTFCWRKFIDDM